MSTFSEASKPVPIGIVVLDVAAHNIILYLSGQHIRLRAYHVHNFRQGHGEGCLPGNLVRYGISCQLNCSSVAGLIGYI